MRILLYVALYLVVGWVLCNSIITRSSRKNAGGKLEFAFLWFMGLILWLPLVVLGISKAIRETANNYRS